MKPKQLKAPWQVQKAINPKVQLVGLTRFWEHTYSRKKKMQKTYSFWPGIEHFLLHCLLRLLQVTADEKQRRIEQKERDCIERRLEFIQWKILDLKATLSGMTWMTCYSCHVLMKSGANTTQKGTAKRKGLQYYLGKNAWPWIKSTRSFSECLIGRSLFVWNN